MPRFLLPSARPPAETRPAHTRRLDEGQPPLALKTARSLARSQAYQTAADAASTLRAYKTDLANFKAWCAERDLDPMPSTPELVGAYLADAGRGYALSTLRRRVAAIARAHRIAKQPLDTRHPAIRETLRGIGRTHGEPPRRPAALATSDIKQLLTVCGDDMAGVRDQALFLVCFAGALRRSELVGLDAEHLTWTTAGLTLLITRSKTDKEGARRRNRHPLRQQVRDLPSQCSAVLAGQSGDQVRANLPESRPLGKGSCKPA